MEFQGITPELFVAKRIKSKTPCPSRSMRRALLTMLSSEPDRDSDGWDGGMLCCANKKTQQNATEVTTNRILRLVIRPISSGDAKQRSRIKRRPLFGVV